MTTEAEKEYLLKICIIGEKTEINTKIGRLTADHYDENSLLQEVEIDTKKISIEKVNIKMIIVITAGQEFFGKLRPSNYRGAAACHDFKKVQNFLLNLMNPNTQIASTIIYYSACSSKIVIKNLFNV